MVLAATVLQACSEPAPPVVVDDAGQLVDILTQIVVDDESFDAVAPRGLPLDLLLHPQSRMEAVSLQAILHTNDKITSPAAPEALGLMVQLERFAITASIDEQSNGSDWHYQGVMRSRVSIDAATDDSRLAQFATMPARQSVQRMALDLAGATENRLWVGGDNLKVTLSDPNSDSCERTYQLNSVLSSTVSLTLNIELRQCSDIQSVAQLRTWLEPGFAVSGQLLQLVEGEEANTTPLSGFGWMRHSHGNLLPSGQSPVVLDEANVRLADGRLLEVTRSKRRSGRGPRTVSARLMEPGGQWRTIAMEWEDSDAQRTAASGNEYPASIRLVSTESSIDIVIAPLNRMLESMGVSGNLLSVPVIVEGSDSGTGFVSYVPLASA